MHAGRQADTQASKRAHSHAFPGTQTSQAGAAARERERERAVSPAHVVGGGASTRHPLALSQWEAFETRSKHATFQNWGKGGGGEGGGRHRRRQRSIVPLDPDHALPHLSPSSPAHFLFFIFFTSKPRRHQRAPHPTRFSPKQPV